LEIWEHSRKEPLQSYKWGLDTFTCVRFNPVETDVFVACSRDHNILLHDLRTPTPIQSITLPALSNAVAWNPHDILSFTTANDDSNLYTFDIRRLKSALLVHQDFVSSVLDIDYSPKGNVFVAGSSDRSVRIFGKAACHSCEIYHTERMQRVLAVKFNSEGSLVFTGSDDMNLRMWKSNEFNDYYLSQKKRDTTAYNHIVTDRYKQIRRLNTILKNRFLPKPIFFSTTLKRKTLKRLA